MQFMSSMVFVEAVGLHLHITAVASKPDISFPNAEWLFGWFSSHMQSRSDTFCVISC